MAAAWWHNDKTWTTREGEVILLERLTPQHRANVQNMLLRNAERIREAMVWNLALASMSFRGELALDALEFEMTALEDRTAEDAVKGTPLMRRLAELDAQDAGEAPS